MCPRCLQPLGLRLLLNLNAIFCRVSTQNEYLRIRRINATDICTGNLTKILKREFHN